MGLLLFTGALLSLVGIGLLISMHIATYKVYGEHTNYWYWIEFLYVLLFHKHVIKFEYQILHGDPALTSTDNYGNSDDKTLDVYGRKRSGIFLSDLSPDAKAFLKDRGIKHFYTRHIFTFQEPCLYFMNKQGYTVWLLAHA